MKIIYSEYNQDYAHYQFPYCIWALEEEGDCKHDFFESGFLPSGRDPLRYYLSRSVRVSCEKFYLSSENKRILSKNVDIKLRLVRRVDFIADEAIINMCLESGAFRFGEKNFDKIRLLSLLSSPHTSHFLIFTSGKEIIGIVTCLSDESSYIHYNFSFFKLNCKFYNLAIYMMTMAISFSRESGLRFIYLGTAYTYKSRYKIQYKGIEFFNGRNWSSNIQELKYLMHRDGSQTTKHLFECEDYVKSFLANDLNSLNDKRGM